jgi:3-amino-4-hydroxybenzoic acid synthase
MKGEKTLWFEITADTNIDTVDKVCQSEYNILMIDIQNLGLLDHIKLPQRMKLAVRISQVAGLGTLSGNDKIMAKVEYLIAADLSMCEEIRGRTDRKVGLLINVNDKPALDQTVELVQRNLDLVIIEFKDPTNIPLELILATTQKSQCRILKKVKDSRDGEVSLMTMEAGADGIMFSSNNIEEIVRMGNVIGRSNRKKFELKEAIVTRVKPAGMGTRVCIDTTSELTQGEGMILGSTSSGGLLTCSETHFLPYMNLRTFRVNAGGIHLYVWGPNEQAVYLSDLRAADPIYVVNASGEARVVTVGRLKIESRPLLYIECEIDGVKINTFIQDDWHVRMFGSKGEILPSSEIKTGQKMLGYLDKPGRHVGIKIDETIKEV